jgi:hypothetical protein
MQSWRFSIFNVGVILLGNYGRHFTFVPYVDRVEAVMSPRIQPPAKFCVMLIAYAFRDAFNCLDCIQPNDRVTAKHGLEITLQCAVVTCFLR